MVQRRDFLKSGGFTAAICGMAGVNMAGNTAAEGIPTGVASKAHPVWDPSLIDVRLDSRSINFENPTGARGGGGKARGGRKGRPSPILAPGQKLVLADIKGSGTIRHIWMTLAGIGVLVPEVARSLRVEVFYDGLAEPSISTPVLDFFGLPHGRVAEYYSAMISAHEGRGLNSHIPMPFRHSIRVEFTNESRRHVPLPYQIDYTMEPPAENPSYLHATFRRENPTKVRRDFVIAEGFKGPGRFLGCAVGVRVLDKQRWYGEGEVKIYRDGDREFPTICGTGLEDYVGSAGGLNRHYSQYAGAPIIIPPPPANALVPTPDFVSFYRWHIPDPIMFSQDLRVTIQQIGGATFKRGEEALFEAFKKKHSPSSFGWTDLGGDLLAVGGYERSDDYCATAFVYCRHPQSVPRYKTDMATRDIGSLPIEAHPDAAVEEEWERINRAAKKAWDL
jgi:hypothetical protein